MASLSPDDIKLLESKLRLQRQDVLQAIRQRLHHANGSDELALINHFADVREQAEADLLNDTDIGQLQIELGDLHDIDDAIAKSETGIYGICTSCGVPIAARRLRAQPAAQRCLACQEAFEQYRQTRSAAVR